jgi:hypothetical protein
MTPEHAQTQIGSEPRFFRWQKNAHFNRVKTYSPSIFRRLSGSNPHDFAPVALLLI